jgi:hypothetical protein
MISAELQADGRVDQRNYQTGRYFRAAVFASRADP